MQVPVSPYEPLNIYEVIELANIRWWLHAHSINVASYSSSPYSEWKEMPQSASSGGDLNM